MKLNQQNTDIVEILRRSTYKAPQIEVTIITMESNFAAGSIIKLNFADEDNHNPMITDWVDRENEQTWVF